MPAVPPNCTVAPETKLDPEIVTCVPPAVLPEFGEMPVIVTAFVAVVND